METLHKIGQIIANRYGVTDILGRGGIATTYAAKDLTTNQPVALKELSLRRMGEFKVLELFEREARTLKQINYSAIPSYLDYFYVDTANDRAFYIVQELAEGKSLAERVAEGWRTNESGVRQIAAKVLNILIYLQTQKPPIFHRDIKPQNLVLREDGSIFLVDFGAVQDTYRTTVARGSTVVGTYGYMAPEQFRGEAVPATDLYGLGTTLLFLLTHRCPSELPQERLRYNFRDRIQVSDEFADWLQQMVEPDAEDRFSSAKEALAALQGKRIRGKARSPIPLKTAIGLGVAIVIMLNAPKYLKATWLNLASGSNVSAFDAAYSGDIDMLNSVLFWEGLRQNKEIRAREATRLLQYASSAEVVELLIARGADVTVTDDEGKTLLHWAPVSRPDFPYGKRLSEGVVKALVAGGADINAKDIYGYTPLHSLIKSEYLYYREMTQTEFEEMIAQTWIANGADINAQDRYGRTPLHWAVSIWARDQFQSRSPLSVESVAEALIANGADVSAKDHHGRTPLHVSVEYFPESTATKVVNVLIDHGAQVDAKDNDGRTPLHLVMEGENVVGILSSYSSDSSLRNPRFSLRESNFTLHGEEEIEIVFNGCSGASLAQPPSEWWTSRVELASLLLTHGARVNARDNSNHTPLELATRICGSNIVAPQTKVTELVELLKRYGAREGKDD